MPAECACRCRDEDRKCFKTSPSTFIWKHNSANGSGHSTNFLYILNKIIGIYLFIYFLQFSRIYIYNNHEDRIVVFLTVKLLQ